MHLSRAARVVLFLALSSGLARAGEVRIAERPLLGPFPTIQAGIDAALEGESLVVTPGTYASFTIDAKSVNVLVPGTGTNDWAKITGKLRIQNLGPAQHAVLTRIKLTGGPSTVPYDPACEIASITGHVRIEDCSFKGMAATWTSWGPSPTTGTAVRVTSSLNVVFSGCDLWGGEPLAIGNGGDPPTDAGHALDSVNSSIALYDCYVSGGNGSYESTPRGGHGGDGYRGLSYGLFASGCDFKGGWGGGGDYTGCFQGGAGGDGIVMDAGQLRLLDNLYAGGGGGWALCGPFGPPGAAIVPLNGAIVDLMAGNQRQLAAPAITSDDASVPITVTGQPGDEVWLMVARRPAFVWKPALHGVWMVPQPLFTTSGPAGTIGTGGTLVIDRTFAIPDGTVEARGFWLQALCVDASGVPTLTGPAHVLSRE